MHGMHLYISTHSPLLQKLISMIVSGPTVSPASGKPAKQIVIFLHGYGADGANLIDLSEHFSDLLPDAFFAAPDAPFPCEMSSLGRQWFSLATREFEPIWKGIRHAATHLNRFIDDTLNHHGLDESSVILIGFSQGTMMALHTALRREKPIAGVIGFSGRLVGPTLLADEIKSRPPVCLIHGDADAVVPYASLKDAEDILRTHDVTIETHTRAGIGHSIDCEGVAIARKFLQNTL